MLQEALQICFKFCFFSLNYQKRIVNNIMFESSAFAFDFNPSEA